MKKTIEFSLPLLGLKDPYRQLAVVLLADGTIAGKWLACTVPNWKKPGKNDRPNLKEYPVIVGGMYSGYYSVKGHKQSRPAIVMEDNGAVPIYQRSNPNYPAQGKSALYIHIHEGETEGWRGSGGCPTLAKGGGKWLGTMFDEGEPVRVIIPDPFWFVFEGR